MTSSMRDLSDKSAPDVRQKQPQPEIQHQSPANANIQHSMAVPSSPYMLPQNPIAMGHIMAPTAYPIMDPYYGGMIAAYGGQTMVNPNLTGIAHPGVPLPTDAVEEPVYVNAKQYHGILRRRQSRAKAESENKLIKSRKPYLHESRHLHALKRARGQGGRFLNTKSEDNEQNAILALEDAQSFHDQQSGASSDNRATEIISPDSNKFSVDDKREPPSDARAP